MAILILKRSAAASSPITASLVASRTSGPAPLAVFFDATGTTHTDGSINTFRSIGYSFNFGETGLGNWAFSGIDKNVHRGGPLCAHTFETPGTYTVKVKGRDASGNTHQTSVTITVTDPDVVYSGTNTVCISTNTDTTGAPAGAQLLTNQTSWPTRSNGKRYLLRAGQSFASCGAWTFNNLTDAQLGKFGAGANPIVSNLCGQAGTGTPTQWAERCVAYDIVSSGSGNSDLPSVDLLFLRCSWDSGAASAGNPISFSIGNLISHEWNNTPSLRPYLKWPIGMALIECTIVGGQYNVFGYIGRYASIMGCDIQDTWFHNVRLTAVYKDFFAHNSAKIIDQNLHHFKIQATGLDPYDDDLNVTTEPISQYFLLSNNSIGDASATNVWAIGIGPQNTTAQEGLQDWIVENNVANHNYTLESHNGGQRGTTRGNTLSVGGTWGDGTASSGDVPSGYNGPYYLGVTPPTTEDPT